MNLSRYIDHTVLKPTTTLTDIENVSAEALEYDFFAVCVPPLWVQHAQRILAGSSVKTATVIGFPFGYSAVTAKLAEVEQAIADGADELDVVINLSALKNGDRKYLQSEIKVLLAPVRANGRLIKVIIESGVLTNEEIIQCCGIYGEQGVDFLKTSTGYAEKGATTEALQLMRANLPSSIKLKASGGIRTYEQAMQMIEAGADRLGCSASLAIVKGETGNLAKNLY
jgi:deoxyribose-phosphate aldolase